MLQYQNPIDRVAKRLTLRFAKPPFAGSNPASVSHLQKPTIVVFCKCETIKQSCPDGVIGSHARLKILWSKGRAGSIPALGT